MAASRGLDIPNPEIHPVILPGPLGDLSLRSFKSSWPRSFAVARGVRFAAQGSGADMPRGKNSGDWRQAPCLLPRKNDLKRINFALFAVTTLKKMVSHSRSAECKPLVHGQLTPPKIA